MRQDVFILGATWSVGTELVRQICEFDGDGKNHGNPTQIIGFANSKWMVLGKWMIPEQEMFEQIVQADNWNIEKVRERIKDETNKLIQTKWKQVSLNGVLQALTALWYHWSTMIVDTTAMSGQWIIDFHLQALDKWFKIVTANKNPAALSTQTEFEKLTRHHGSYDYDTAVMAWSGAVNWIKDRVNVSSPVLEIAGCFSGTLGYICSELEKWEKTFSQIVRKALEIKYTEPHPRDDLSWFDVMRKLMILLRTAWVFVSQNDIELQGFIPKSYLEIADVEEFLQSLENIDAEMAERFSQAKTRGNTLRYVARYRKESEKPWDGYIWLHFQPKITIKLEEVSRNSTLWALKGTKNAVSIHSPNHMGDACFDLSAPGAGVERTAESLRAGLADMIPWGLDRIVK